MRKTLLLLISAVVTAWAENPMLGTWKISLEKSQLSNPAAWKKRVMIIESPGRDAYRVIFMTPEKEQQTEETRFLDGKEHPRSTNPGETIVWRKINNHHHTVVFRRGGKEIGSIDGTVSADGRVMTNVYMGIDGKGEQIQERRVWERQ